MKRVRLEYLDQNEGFSRCMPRTGCLAGQYTSTDGAKDWCHVVLDVPISYGTVLMGRFVKTGDLLIRPREVGGEVGSARPTSVFLVLVEPPQLPLVTPLRISDYLLVAWGTCHTVS